MFIPTTEDGHMTHCLYLVIDNYIIAFANSGEGYVISRLCVFVCLFVSRITEEVVNGL